MEKKLIPFLKWAGGKRWLVEDHEELFNLNYNRFIEPFLGSGAVFFKLLPKKSLISDKNVELIDTYIALQEDWKAVYRKLKQHHLQHSAEYYYRVRASKPRVLSSRAAKFIYLNRTCWNGLYRVNLKGEFNVPIGTKRSVVLPSDDFSRTSELLRTSDIRACDFEETIEEAQGSDFIFVDPPYTVKHNNNGFIKYNESIFTWKDQIRLRDAVLSAVRRGVQVMVTNANHDSVLELYEKIGTSVVLGRRSTIAGSASSRGRYEEIVIKCF